MARTWWQLGEGEFNTDIPRTGRGIGAGEACGRGVPRPYIVRTREPLRPA